MRCILRGPDDGRRPTKRVTEWHWRQKPHTRSAHGAQVNTQQSVGRMSTNEQRTTNIRRGDRALEMYGIVSACRSIVEMDSDELAAAIIIYEATDGSCWLMWDWLFHSQENVTFLSRLDAIVGYVIAICYYCHVHVSLSPHIRDIYLLLRIEIENWRY